MSSKKTLYRDSVTMLHTRLVLFIEICIPERRHQSSFVDDFGLHKGCCQFACLCLVSWTLVRQQKVRLTKRQVVGTRHCASRIVQKRMKLSLGNVKATLDFVRLVTGVLGYLVNAIGRRTHVLGSDIEFQDLFSPGLWVIGHWILERSPDALEKKMRM